MFSVRVNYLAAQVDFNMAKIVSIKGLSLASLLACQDTHMCLAYRSFRPMAFCRFLFKVLALLGMYILTIDWSVRYSKENQM